jgi:outer membrane usher protein
MKMVRWNRAPWWRLSSPLVALSLALSAGLLPLRAVAKEGVPLQLEVSINGHKSGYIAAFTLFEDGQIASTRGELAELGIAAAGTGSPEEDVILNDMQGLTYTYLEEQQAINLEPLPQQRIAAVFDLEDRSADVLPDIGTGLYVNYSLFASAASDKENHEYGFTGASAQLDSHFYSAAGTLTQSDLIGHTPEGDSNYTRLDTTYSFSSIRHMSTMNIGDLIAGGLTWTRPIRMGGLQIRRDFETRPDLVTIPLPSFEGTAAVPSTVDVFVNNVKTHSQDISEGPFRFDNLPMSGSGNARIVVRDAQGRETIIDQPFYASSDLLRPGLFDYSVEVGVVRYDHGRDSFNYDERLVGSISARYGLTEDVTLEGHAEGGADLLNGGLGAVWNAGAFGTLSVAGAASVHEDGFGGLVRAGWDVRFGDFNLNASTRRLLGQYSDLAIATAESDFSHDGLMLATATDQISLGYSFREWGSGIGIGFVHAEYSGEPSRNLLTATFSQSLPRNISIFATGFVDLSDRDSASLFAGFSMPLGRGYDWSGGIETDRGGVQGWTAVAKSSNGEPGSAGWRVQYNEGQTRRLQASGNYSTTKAQLYGYAEAGEDQVRAEASVDGAIVANGEGLFLGRRVRDAFAVVDVGASGVDVYSQNRLVGQTGRSGKLLVPDLQAYQANQIRIGTDNLPINAEVQQTEARAVAARNSGSVVNFGVKSDAQSALVVLRNADGEFLPVGTIARLQGSADEFIVGYDGQVYLTGLRSNNNIEAHLANGTCEVNFSYVAEPGSRTVIEGGICQ